MTCPKCMEHIYSDDELQCKECKRTFHYFCCGQNEKMKPAAKARFRCIDCTTKTKSPEHNTKIAPTAQKKENEELAKSTAEPNEYFERKFQEMMKSMADNKDEVIRTLEERVKGLEKQLQERDTKVQDLEDRIEMLESRSRINNIEIRNMPETRGEDIVHLVGEIGKAIGIQDMKEGDIQVAHRVDSRNTKEKGRRPIIVHLKSRYMKNKWLAKYKECRKSKSGGKGNLMAKDVNKALQDTPIYLNEHITVQKKILLKDIKDFAKTKEIKYVWIKEGFILIKKNDEDNSVKKINSRREFDTYKINFAN